MSAEKKLDLKALHDMLDKARVALLHVKDRLPSPKENDYNTVQRVAQVLFDRNPQLAAQVADVECGDIYPEYKEAWQFMVEAICDAEENFKEENKES